MSDLTPPPTPPTPGDPHQLLSSWPALLAALATAVGGTGLIAAIARFADRILPSADARLTARTTQTAQLTEQLTALYEENEHLREALQAMTNQWLEAEKRYLEQGKRLVAQDAQAELVRKNVEKDGTDTLSPQLQLGQSPSPPRVTDETEALP